MRTTLEIPGPLLDEARHLLGFKSKTDTIIQALREMVRRHRIDSLRRAFGTIRLDIDVAKSRRRPRK